MGPDDYIPICDALGEWPEWRNDDEGLQERLKPWTRQASHKWWFEWMDGNCKWHRGMQLAPHVALCILEKWFREKLTKAGISIIRRGTTYYCTRDGGAYLALDGTGWHFWGDGNATRFDTYAEAQLAAGKTLCKETDDGEA